MFELGIIILISMPLAILAGTLEHYRNIKNLRELGKKTRRLSKKHCLSCIIFSVCFGIVVYSRFGSKYVEISNDFFINFAFLVCSVSAVVLFFIEYDLIDKFKQNEKLYTALLAFLALIVTVLTGIYVDSEIYKLTLEKAEYFPNAQKLMAIILSPILWGVVLLVFSMAIYFMHAILLASKALREISYLQGVYRSLYFLFGVKPSKERLNVFIDMAILSGFFVIIMWFSAYMKYFTSDKGLQNAIKKALVHSSFYEASGRCKNIVGETGQKLYIAFLKNDIVSVYKLNSDGSDSFNTDQCKS